MTWLFVIFKSKVRQVIIQCNVLFELMRLANATGERLQLSFLLNISSFIYPQEETCVRFNIFPYAKDLGGGCDIPSLIYHNINIAPF